VPTLGEFQRVLEVEIDVAEVVHPIVTLRRR
jgi:hypothetical protein